MLVLVIPDLWVACPASYNVLSSTILSWDHSSATNGENISGIPLLLLPSVHPDSHMYTCGCDVGCASLVFVWLCFVRCFIIEHFKHPLLSTHPKLIVRCLTIGLDYTWLPRPLHWLFLSVFEDIGSIIQVPRCRLATPLPLLGNFFSVDTAQPWLTFNTWRSTYGGHIVMGVCS